MVTIELSSESIHVSWPPCLGPHLWTELQMTTQKLAPADLRLTIPADALGYSDTSELLEYALPWIGQERAEIAARFGLGMDQRDYNLFVLGEVGSGRSSLLRQAMLAAAASKAVPSEKVREENRIASKRSTAISKISTSNISHSDSALRNDSVRML